MKHDKAQWLAFIKEQQQSDVSIAAFCREKNIKVKYFYYHRTKYLKSINPSPFVRANPPSIKAPDDKSPSLTLRYGSGQLYLPAGVSTVWLASLMKALA
ncbi:MAG: hypothetical protein ACJA0N_002739 [Pseudohongiellaceae bacterium]|jgi:hypothetical protein